MQDDPTVAILFSFSMVGSRKYFSVVLTWTKGHSMAARLPVDLEALVEQWAKDYFLRKASSAKERKIVEKDRLNVQVDWRKVQFRHNPPEYTPTPPKVGEGRLSPNTLFQATFKNRTERRQTYNFKAERTTRSCCIVELESSYTKGFGLEIKLEVPGNIMEANAGFNRELTIREASSSTIEEELMWGVNSDIEVEPRHEASAKMVITEEEYSGSFHLQTAVSGILHVSFHNLKDNNSFIRKVEPTLYDVMSWAQEKRILPSTDAVVLDKTVDGIMCNTRGKVNFKYGLKQDVEVEQRRIVD